MLIEPAHGKTSKVHRGASLQLKRNSIVAVITCKLAHFNLLMEEMTMLKEILITLPIPTAGAALAMFVMLFVDISPIFGG